MGADPESLNDNRKVNIIHDHDSLVEMKFKVAALADIDDDHESRIRDLENRRVRTLENQQHEWKGALKTWGIVLLLAELILTIISMKIMKGP